MRRGTVQGSWEEILGHAQLIGFMMSSWRYSRKVSQRQLLLLSSCWVREDRWIAQENSQGVSLSIQSINQRVCQGIITLGTVSSAKLLPGLDKREALVPSCLIAKGKTSSGSIGRLIGSI